MDLAELKDEISNLQNRLDSKLAEVIVFNKCNDYIKAAECGREIIHLAEQLHMRTAHLQDLNNFYGLIDNLQNRGITARAVKRYVEKV